MKFELIDLTVLLPQSITESSESSKIISSITYQLFIPNQLMIISVVSLMRPIKQMISYSYGAKFGVMEVASGWHSGCEMIYHLT